MIQFVHLSFFVAFFMQLTYYFDFPCVQQGKQPGSVLPGMSFMFRIAKNKYYYLKAALE